MNAESGFKEVRSITRETLASANKPAIWDCLLYLILRPVTSQTLLSQCYSKAFRE